MPFPSNADLPKSIKMLPSEAQTVWRNVFNRLEKQGIAEESAIKQSWVAVKNGWKKNPEGEWVRKMKEQEFAEPSVNKDGTANLKGLEIFAAGKWNGKEFSIKDLDTIVNNFNVLKDRLKPFLKLGHDDKQKLLQRDGFNAAGWITNVYRIGKKLLADITDMPKKVFELIQKKAFRKISSEIFSGFKDEDKEFGLVLKGAAILGTDIPAVRSLDDILSLYNSEKSGAEVYCFDLDDNQKITEEVIEMAIWSRAFINDLPDSSFAIILPRGKKDEEGRTTPRSLRKLPFKDQNGKIDLPHLRNALARLPQTDLTSAQKAKARKVLAAAAKSAGVGEFEEKGGENAMTEELEKKVEVAEKKVEEAETKVEEQKQEIEKKEGEIEKLTDKINKMEGKMKEKEIDDKVSNLLNDGRITPAQSESLKAILMSISDSQIIKLSDKEVGIDSAILDLLKGSSEIQFSQVSKVEGKETKKQDEISALIEKVAKEHNLDLSKFSDKSEAMALASKEKPELFEARTISKGVN